MAIEFYDFFCGCGGTSRGMQRAGITVRLGLDSDPDAQRTFKENHKEAHFICKDIRKVSVPAVVPYVDRKPGHALLFGACAPCQPFSKQRRAKRQRDARRSLLHEFHRFVEAFLPEYVFLENVPGMRDSSKRKNPFRVFAALLDDLGYRYESGVVMACNFGVPQRRSRLVLLATRLGAIELPPPTHGPGTGRDWPTVWDWISHLPPIEAGETHPEIPNHRAAHLSELNLRRITQTPIGGDRRSWPSDLELKCHRNHSGHTDVYGRMLKNRPSPALTTRCISLSNGRFGHPVQNRAISVREAACIQTFPMDFVFHGNLNSTARQVGNAVPVVMAEAFANHIVAHYRKNRHEVLSP